MYSPTLPGILRWWLFSLLVKTDSRDSVDYSPPGSSVHGISQARILEYQYSKETELSEDR